MTARVVGQYPAGCSRDSEGYRTYKIKFLVLHGPADGPTVALTASGLPAYGSTWQFQDGNDLDSYAWCRWDADVQPYGTDKEVGLYHTVELTFSTKPLESKRCHQTEAGNPLLEPPKVSGGFTKYTEEATHDRFGQPLFNSAFEMFRGPQVEFDANRPTVKVEMPVATFDVVALAYSMIDTVNSSPLWGFGTRCVKLSNAPWEKKFYGTCFAYYVLTLEFDVRPDGTFDRDLLDEGHKVLSGHWDPSTTPPAAGLWVVDNVGSVPASNQNPTHFIRFKDRNDENTSVILNGAGLPALVGVQGGQLYVSVHNVLANQGNPLSDGNFWRAITSAETPGWDSNADYSTGQMVTSGGHVYVAEDGSRDDEPPGLFNSWKLVNGSVSDKGTYNAATDYGDGDYVRPSSATGAPGHRVVQKYNESDFTLLGIPLTL